MGIDLGADRAKRWMLIGNRTVLLECYLSWHLSANQRLALEPQTITLNSRFRYYINFQNKSARYLLRSLYNTLAVGGFKSAQGQ